MIKFGPTPGCSDCKTEACPYCRAKIMSDIERSRPVSSYTKPKKGTTTATTT